MKKIIYLLSMVMSSVAWGQTANSSYEQLAYKDAIKKYESIIKKDGNNGEAIYNLATAYRLNNETVKAEQWYAKAVKYSSEPKAQLYYAQMLLSNGKPLEAKEAFKVYKTNVSRQDSKRIDGFIELCDKIENGEVRSKGYDVKEVMFNSGALDFSPTYYGEDKILFVSNRKNSSGPKNVNDSWTSQRYNDLFVADLANGSKVERMKKRINTRFHEGSATFSKDLNTIYYTSNNYIKSRLKDDEEDNVRLQIVSSTFEDEKWTKAVKLPFNNDNYSYAHPTLSSDEQTMIFSSDQPGGYGGMDLYMVKKEGDSWGVPVNLGPTINTIGNETFPRLDENGDLTFSSDFHPGFGGLDLFSAKRIGNKFGAVENLGLPLNSAKDDFGLISKNNFNEGYFSSNRTGDDQIYTFKNVGERKLKGRVVNCKTGEAIPEADVSIFERSSTIEKTNSNEEGYFFFSVSPEMNAQTLKAEAQKIYFMTNEECPGVQEFIVGDDVELVLALDEKPAEERFSLCGRVLNEDCNFLLNDVKLKLINICSGEEVEMTSDQNGEFTADLVDDCKYQIVAEKKNFSQVVQTFTTEDLASEECLPLEVKMNPTTDLRDPNNPDGANGPGKILLKEGTVVDLYNIYFDLDKYFIRNDGLEELEWVRRVMEEYTDMKVEISAHTDSRATNEYNNTLSANRAKSAKEYLVKRGVAADRIVTKGYGETKLKNACADGVDCSELEHQRNRRVEFKVIKFDGEAVVSKEWSQYKK